MKTLLNKALRKLGLQLVKTKSSKDAFDVQKQLIGSDQKEKVIFDVGAYNGKVSLKYNNLFPNSTLYSFEPFPNSFALLKENTAAYPNINIYNKGLGANVGVSKFHSNQFAETNSILATHEAGNSNWWDKDFLTTKEVIDVELTTIDQVVKENNVSKIDILKMDVQGAEYLVLEGAKESIEKGMIDLIYTEIILIPTYQNQKPFDEMLRLYRQKGFEIFTIATASHAPSGQLQFVDAIFTYSK